MSIAKKFSGNDRMTESLNDSPSTAISVHSFVQDDVNFLEDLRTLLARDFPASRLASPASTSEQMTPETCGPKQLNAFAEYDRNTRCWRMFQGSLLTNTLELFSGSWPRRVTMRNAILFQPVKSVRHIHAKGCSFWPTPRASQGGGNAGGSGARKTALKNGTYIPGKMNPELSEWLMGFPIGWTELKVIDIMQYLKWEIISNAAKNRTDGEKLRCLWWKDDPTTMEERQAGFNFQEQEVLLGEMLRQFQHLGELFRKCGAKESAAFISDDCLPRLRTKIQNTKASCGRKSVKQFFGKYQDFMSILSYFRTQKDWNMGARECSSGDLQNLREGISAGEKKRKGAAHMRSENVSSENGEIFSRTAVGVKDRVSRLKAIGNAQVPAVVAEVWRMLSSQIKQGENRNEK